MTDQIWTVYTSIHVPTVASRRLGIGNVEGAGGSRQSLLHFVNSMWDRHCSGETVNQKENAMILLALKYGAIALACGIAGGAVVELLSILCKGA
jgi:hypothetical protein